MTDKNLEELGRRLARIEHSLFELQEFLRVNFGVALRIAHDLELRKKIEARNKKIEASAQRTLEK